MTMCKLRLIILVEESYPVMTTDSESGAWEPANMGIKVLVREARLMIKYWIKHCFCGVRFHLSLGCLLVRVF